jgi:pyruvate kinase
MLTRCTCHATRGGDLLTVPPPCRPAGTTAAMVAKYRPVMPILTLVVPYLKRDGLKWKLEGRHAARQALLTSGLMPMLAAPTPSAGESLIEEAVQLALAQGWVERDDHVVVLSRSQADEVMVKVRY